MSLTDKQKHALKSFSENLAFGNGIKLHQFMKEAVDEDRKGFAFFSCLKNTAKAMDAVSVSGWAVREKKASLKEIKGHLQGALDRFLDADTDAALKARFIQKVLEHYDLPDDEIKLNPAAVAASREYLLNATKKKSNWIDNLICSQK